MSEYQKCVLPVCPDWLIASVTVLATQFSKKLLYICYTLVSWLHQQSTTSETDLHCESWMNLQSNKIWMITEFMAQNHECFCRQLFWLLLITVILIKKKKRHTHTQKDTNLEHGCIYSWAVNHEMLCWLSQTWQNTFCKPQWNLVTLI